jgi:dsDNA-specific endonuclease/ATPase MutS2
LNEVLFTDNLPKLDIHGYDRMSARVAIGEYINDNIKMGNEIFLIIHGIGNGILKEATHNYLKNNKRVLEYKLNNFNSGCTMVRIRL